MPPAVRSPNAKPQTRTLDPDARELLRAMATGKTLGAFVSGLIRNEAMRREERARLKQALLEVIQDA
jgi:chorismate synthase